MGHEIPSDWITDKLGNLGVFKSAGADKKENTNEAPIGLVNYMDVYRNTKLDNSFVWMRVTAKPAEIQKCNLLKGDILFTPSSETPDDIGHSAVVMEDLKDAIFSYHLVRLRLHNQDILDLDFRRYFLNHYPVAKYFHSRATGITRYTLSRNDFRNCVVSFPKDINEQRTIASILCKVDEAIVATKNSIAKAERLKKALMQNLLTGKLKPDGTWRKEDEFYKDEKFGFLPNGWVVQPLKRLATIQRGRFGHRPRNEPRFYGGNHPFVQTSDVVNSVFYLKDYSQTLSDAGTHVSRKFPKGTIIITIAANIGDVALTKYDVYFPDSLIGVNHNEEIINDEFLLLSLMTKKQFLNQVSTESAQKNVNYGNLRSLPIFFPIDKTEQIKIAKKIKAVFDVIEQKQTKIKKLERLKKALMQNLLTGKVRVKVPNEELQVETK